MHHFNIDHFCWYCAFIAHTPKPTDIREPGWGCWSNCLLYQPILPIWKAMKDRTEAQTEEKIASFCNCSYNATPCSSSPFPHVKNSLGIFKCNNTTSLCLRLPSLLPNLNSIAKQKRQWHVKTCQIVSINLTDSVELKLNLMVTLKHIVESFDLFWIYCNITFWYYYFVIFSWT